MKNYLLAVYIEVKAKALNRPFSYYYQGDSLVMPGMRVLLDFNKRIVMAYVSEVQELSESIVEHQKKNTYKLKEISEIVDTEPIIGAEMFMLAQRLADYYLVPLILVLQTMLPPSLKPMKSAMRAAGIAYDTYLRANDIDTEGLSEKQMAILDHIKSQGKLLKNTIKSPSIVKKLVELGHLEIVKEERQRFEIDKHILKTVNQEHQLSAEQKAVIKDFFVCPQKTVLLQGVTGSGKTEVYLQLAQHYLSRGAGVLLLVPEISLTPLMVALCKARFANQVAVLHGGLTSAQKYDQYRRIKRGEARIVVGARSAIFAPIKDLKLIIIDEEHATTYYQDSSPAYDARVVARLRQELDPDLKILLGSATPSLETKAKAIRKVYGYLELNKRINEWGLPEVKIINVQDPSNLYKDSLMISLALKQALDQALARREQAILLLNRRGYASFLECESCHHVILCPECGMPLSYHKEDQTMKCHRCNKVFPYPRACPSCGYQGFHFMGFGTQMVFEEIQELYPDKKIARLDQDVKNNDEGQMVRLLDDFRQGKYDILIGTQMIAKGHDFENVTLSAVLMADIGLKIPSYRSNENAFSLIYQSIGRSGRGQKKGTAIIQTFHPQHYAIKYAAQQDYEAFFKQEMAVRKITNYPPYTQLVLFDIYVKPPRKIEEIGFELRSFLEHKIGDQPDCLITGPYEPYVKKHGPYRRQMLLIRIKELDKIRDILKEVLQNSSFSRDVRLELRLQPLDIF